MRAARQQDPQVVAAAYRHVEALVLSLDGLQPEKGHETLSVVRELNAKRIWCAEALLSSKGAALLLRCLEPSYPSPLMSCVVISLFLQQSVAMWGEPWASLRILPGDCVGTPVVRGRPSTHQNRH